MAQVTEDFARTMLAAPEGTHYPLTAHEERQLAYSHLKRLELEREVAALRALLRECHQPVFNEHMAVIGTRVAKPGSLLARVNAALDADQQPLSDVHSGVPDHHECVHCYGRIKEGEGYVVGPEGKAHTDCDQAVPREARVSVPADCGGSTLRCDSCGLEHHGAVMGMACGWEGCAGVIFAVPARSTSITDPTGVRRDGSAVGDQVTGERVKGPQISPLPGGKAP